MDNINYLITNLFIQIKPSNSYKPSFVWNYFGRLYKKPNEAIDLEKFYCKICFDKFKSEEPGTVFSSVQKKIAVYSATSFTGNMKSHLLAIHRISEPQQTKTTNQHILSMFSRDHHSQKASQLKQQLGHQLTLMCCRDLLPFSIVDNEDFLICNKIVNSKEDIPSRTILSPINLNKIYDVCVERTNEKLKLASPFPTITCDIWCDKYKHRSFICFTIHYLDSNLHLHKYSLKTQPFDGPHTGEAIKDLFAIVLNEFNLSSNNIIVRLNKFDWILTPTENEIVRDLVDFLSSFETTTTILSASKSYPTMSLCLLLRIEIESMLHSTATESSVIEELKHLLSKNLDTRFPITPLNICGFLLDPSQLKIDINRYLTQNNTTEEKLLLDMIKKFKIDHVSRATTIENIHTSSTSSSATTSETSSPRIKRNLSVEYMYESQHNMKKLRENLIQKHTPSPIISIDPIIAEIDSYLKSDVVCDDVLAFWRSSGDKFYHLKRLAQIVLAILATSTPSEQVFSTTELILNAKRTMLASENVGKIQMIHDNYDLLKKN